MDFPETPPLVHIDRADPWLWAGYLAILIAVHLIARLVTLAGIAITAWPARRARGKHWSERARWTYPARRLGVRCMLLVALPLVLVSAREGRRIELLPPVITICLISMAAWSGIVATRIGLEHHFTPAMAMTARPRRAAWISQISLRGGMIVTAFALYGLATRAPGPAAAIILLCGVIFVAAYMRMGWVTILWATGVVRPAGARFQTIVSQTAERMSIHPDQIVEIGLPLANAVAYPLRRAIGITDPALAVLDDDEIAAIAAHESGHLSESRWVRAARTTAPVISGIAVAYPAAVASALSGTQPELGFLLMTLLPVWLIWIVWYRKLARRMEERADALGRQFESAPGVYARALEKLYATNMVPMVIRRVPRRGKPSNQAVHPELYDRLVQAGATPDYPRPAPPPTWPGEVGMVIVIAASAAGCYAVDRLALAVASW